MAEAERLLLADGDDLAEPGARRLERVEALALVAHRRFELEGHVEIIDQRGFAAPGDEDHLLDPGLARLVDRILDQRPIDDRQHFLGHGLGRRKQAGAEPGDRETRPCGRDWLIRSAPGVAGPVSFDHGLGIGSGG